MSHRNYFWPIIIFSLGCALFVPRNDFKRALESYKKGDLAKASNYFNAYFIKHPESETTLYYLYDCYHRLDHVENKVRVLEKFVELGSKDEGVYFSLFYYYQKQSRYRELYILLKYLKPGVSDKMDKHYSLTRRLYAEVLSGASEKYDGQTDPMVFVISQGNLSVFPDNKFYANDTITKGNLIILLDRVIEPRYPKKFLKMKNISNHSFLYLPYMRLVDFGILEFDPNLNPADHAMLSMAVMAIENLKSGGFSEF